MTEPGHGRPNAAPADPAGWIRAIASGLTATGIPATTNGDHIAGLDVTAVICPPGRARAEVMIDEDGWAELRWFTDRTVPPCRRCRRDHPRLNRHHRRPGHTHPRHRPAMTTATPGPGSPPDPDEMALAAAGFPRYRLWRQYRPDRTRYVATARDLTARPHTLVTPSLDELTAELAASKPAAGQ